MKFHQLTEYLTEMSELQQFPHIASINCQLGEKCNEETTHKEDLVTEGDRLYSELDQLTKDENLSKDVKQRVEFVKSAWR